MSRLKDWTAYHLVQPYFFAHHHFHRRKIQTLRRAGLDAWGLSFVPEPLYLTHEARYQDAVASGFMNIVRISDKRRANRAALLFFAKKAVGGQRMLIHVLRCDPTPVIRLRSMPVIGPRIRYILEYEGDTPSELVYQAAYKEAPRPPVEPPASVRASYDRMLAAQTSHAASADGLVLMSKEHIELMETRLGRSVQACCLPTLADPQRIRFDALERDETRAKLGLSGRFVLVYAGNVIAKWQRLDAMCQFVAELSDRIPDLWFLALVRMDDVTMAHEAVERHSLQNRATIQHVPADEVSGFLSAADAALFLRHRHPMNTVVTSGKLGEYLAAGLPVVSTGANAELLNELIRELDAGVFLSDSLTVDDELASAISMLRIRTEDPESRARISEATIQRFSGERDPFNDYVPFIRQIIANRARNDTTSKKA